MNAHLTDHHEDFVQRVSNSKFGIVSVHAFDNTKLNSEEIEVLSNRLCENWGRKLGEHLDKDSVDS
jgi:hypothetical protein